MTKTTFADLGDVEQNVMLQLVQQRATGLVALGASLWRTTEAWQAEDLEPLLTFVIDSLCSRGLVKYRLAHEYPTRRQIPHDIGLTPLGWALMGYARYIPEVGSHDRHGQSPKHVGDKTNYLNHPIRATGGDITREDFPTHRANFPSHIHMYGDEMMSSKATKNLEDPTVLQDPNGTGQRGYIRVTPELEARVLAVQTHLGMTASHREIATECELPVRTVQYILVDLPRLRRLKEGEEEVVKSLKERVYDFIASADPRPVRDVHEVRRVLSLSDDVHNIVHILHSLHAQGRIDFDERGSQGRAEYLNIRLAKKANGKTEKQEAIAKATEELGHPPIDATEVSVTLVEPEPKGYPLLDALLEREGKRIAQDATMMAYVTAAEAIVNIDREAYDLLMAKAAQYDVIYPSPIESEYLRYVADHPTRGDSE
jgi:hypothetical protein